MGVGGLHHAPASLPPGKTRCPLYRRLDGPPGAGLDGCGKSLPHLDSIPGPPSPERVANTDWAIAVPPFKTIPVIKCQKEEKKWNKIIKKKPQKRGKIKIPKCLTTRKMFKKYKWSWMQYFLACRKERNRSWQVAALPSLSELLSYIFFTLHYYVDEFPISINGDTSSCHYCHR